MSNGDHDGGTTFRGVMHELDRLDLTDEQRAELIEAALSGPGAAGDPDELGALTRWAIVHEHANSRGLTIGYRDSGDAPWLLLGMARWLCLKLEVESTTTTFGDGEADG